MFRKIRPAALLLSAVCIAAFGCKPKEVDHPVPTVSPTPAAPVNPFSNEDYANALRSASLKLRGQLPSAAQTADVLDNGRLAYQSTIDGYLVSQEFVSHMREVYKGWFGLGNGLVTVFDPESGQPVSLDTDEPANLATYVLTNDLPWSEVFTADYCVDDNLDKTPCTGRLPDEQRAGILTNQSLLRLYGKPNAFQFQRTSIAHQLMTCGIYPDGGSDLVRTNATGVLPADNPATPPRIHAKYQGSLEGDEGSVFCATCHSSLMSRRSAFVKFDTDGFYRPDFTILDTETPDQNGDKCYMLAPGEVPADRKTCDDQTFDPQLDGCCYDETFTDPNASEAALCMDPSAPCQGIYRGETFSNPAEFVGIALDKSVNFDIFYDCQAQRYYNYAMGHFNGALGLAAGGGAPPSFVDYGVVSKYRSTFEHENLNARELLRVLFTGDEFLSSQAGG